jgi:hypothetical protein
MLDKDDYDLFAKMTEPLQRTRYNTRNYSCCRAVTAGHQQKWTRYLVETGYELLRPRGQSSSPGRVKSFLHITEASYGAYSTYSMGSGGS